MVKKILLILLIAAVLCVGFIVYKNWNSITAFTDALKYSQEELDEKLKQNKDDVQKYIDEKDDITVRDLTEDESKALNQGNLTEEEVIKIITGKEPVKTEPEKNNDKPVDTSNKEEEKSSGQKVSEAIAKLYVQKSIYLNKLDAVEAEVRSIFDGIVASERASGNKFGSEKQKQEKTRLLNEYLPKVASWENECDNMVYKILDEIKSALKESDGDLSIVSKLSEAYLNEKKTKKAYFINRYMD